MEKKKKNRFSESKNQKKVIEWTKDSERCPSIILKKIDDNTERAFCKETGKLCIFKTCPKR